jgi:hypothetical protein
MLFPLNSLEDLTDDGLQELAYQVRLEIDRREEEEYQAEQADDEEEYQAEQADDLRLS